MVKVLFVCVGNASRSQLAQAFAQQHGAGLLDVHSAGTEPRDALDTRVATALQRHGIDSTAFVPKSVDAVSSGPYEWMIRMGCGDVLLVPALHREDWTYPAPSNLSDLGFEAFCMDLEDRIIDFVQRVRVWTEETGFAVASGDHAHLDDADLLLAVSEASPMTRPEPLAGPVPAPLQTPSHEASSRPTADSL
ncbi:MAG: hypothetical protein AAFX41_04990 [Bacteroidota bacterium]